MELTLRKAELSDFKRVFDVYIHAIQVMKNMDINQWDDRKADIGKVRAVSIAIFTEQMIERVLIPISYIKRKNFISQFKRIQREIIKLKVGK